ncbi:hypothetical protein BGZ65_001445 [Modicella reniformis]|uniref:Uncharacterized protein n=1 Tax=Modicella reniformis TaxID=1440133 RepID=A0A9P6LT60_9FUNG|nr:hypothetical protein BGZ65_001445 [Modicella reniformis]
MTAHRGYTIKCPGDFKHCHRNGIQGYETHHAAIVFREEDIEKETNNLTLSQYTSHVKRESEVTFYNPEPVAILTETFTKPTKTKKMIIHLEPWYFEAPERATGSRFNSIVDLSHNLGTAV